MIFVPNLIDNFVVGIHKNCVCAFFKIKSSVNKLKMFNIGHTIICICLLTLLNLFEANLSTARNKCTPSLYFFI
jgi:hypothetical protein